MKLGTGVMNLNLTTATRYGLNVLALLGLAIALYLGRSIFVPLTIAVLLAAMLYPSAVRLHTGYRFPWFLACLTTVLLTVFFGHHLPAGRLRDIVRTERERHHADLERYLALEPMLATDKTQRFPLATLRYGMRYERATLEWLDELEQLLDQEGPGGA